MRRILFSIFCSFFLITSHAFASQCQLDISNIAQKSRILTNNFTVLPGGTSTSAFFQSNDDTRIVVNLGLTTPMPFSGKSLTAYMEEAGTQFSAYVEAAKAQGRPVELATFPVNPVSWRIIEQEKLPNVGPSMVGRMYIRLSDSCMLVANYVSPSSLNLRPKWDELASAIDNLRTDLSPYVQSTQWGPEDTTPVGMSALWIGLISPLSCSIIGFLLLKHLSRLDRPSSQTRIVLACIALIMAGTIAFLHESFGENMKALKYVDQLLLMVCVATSCLLSLLMAQAMTVFALVLSAVTGLTMISLSSFGWVPVPAVGFIVGTSILLMSVLGFLAWTFGVSDMPRLRFKGIFQAKP